MKLGEIYREHKEVTVSKLKLARAKDLAELLHSQDLNFVSLLGCYQSVDSPIFEIVCFNVEVERGQRAVHDIHKVEEIAVVFSEADSVIPEVLALREDFPRIPHTNVRPFEKPKSLCITDQPYEELKRSLTSVRLINLIRRWLSESFKGKLHESDQTLEPIFLESDYNLIIPPDFLNATKPEISKVVAIQGLQVNKTFTFVVDFASEDEQKGKESNFLATVIYADPQTHTVINKKPQNLKELGEILKNANINLIDVLHERLKKFNEESKIDNLFSKYLLMIIAFPKQREGSADIEGVDFFGFACDVQVGDIGKRIGLWEIVNGKPGFLIASKSEGEDVPIEMCKVIFGLNQKKARKLNGVEKEFEEKISMIGLGSLGSHIFQNLVRSGFGYWNLIDEDIILPHNLVRHAAPPFSIGHSKAKIMASFANALFNKKIVDKVIIANAVTPLDQSKHLDEALKESSVVIDCSTSIALARHLVRDRNEPSRKISTFLNPIGDSVIVLAEDKKRSIKLDSLEMQYYRAIVNNEDLRNHLRTDGKKIRYSHACRDITSTISQDHVALNSAVMSQMIKRIVVSEDAVCSIWAINNDRLTLSRQDLQISEQLEFKINHWTVVTDKHFLEIVQKLRKDKLPNETGGVLIGSFDVSRKVVYVVDVVPSPPDSQEWPTSYIRGCKGLQDTVDQIKKTTLGNLEYIGEWHSHPDSVGTRASSNDKKAFAWLCDNMHSEGLPGIMLIVGENSNYGFYINSM